MPEFITFNKKQKIKARWEGVTHNIMFLLPKISKLSTAYWMQLNAINVDAI